jgi:hypothetical protein
MTEDLPGPPAQPGLTPDLILQLATSFMATRYLIAAVEVGVFEALGDAALDLDTGDVYSEDEIRDMLATTGWVMSARRPLTGPASLVVAGRR